MLMNKDQYNRLAPIFNRQQHLIDLEIDRIPMNVNRSGKHYRKLIKNIKQQYGMRHTHVYRV